MEIVHSLSLGTFKHQLSEDLVRTLRLEQQDQVDGWVNKPLMCFPTLRWLTDWGWQKDTYETT